MKKIALLFVAIFATFTFTQAQTLEELKASKAEKEGVKKNIDTEIADLDKLIREFPGWTNGFAGVIGANFAGNNNWFANATENSSVNGIGVAFNAFANGNMDKYFVKNNLNVLIDATRTKSVDIDDATGLEGVETQTSNVATNLLLSNLSGYKFAEQWAASGEAAYETGLFSRSETEDKLVSIFNNPGQLTFSAGASWVPNANTYVYVHPLGYQINFPNADFTSIPGAKLGATYTGTLYRGIDWNTNFNAFLSYSGDDAKGLTAGDLSNWNWLNTFTIADVFKGIGVGLAVGLRSNKQLALNKNIDGNPLQSYYKLGLSYAIGG